MAVEPVTVKLTCWSVDADRERAAGYYAEMPFAAAQVLVEVPYLLAQAVLFSAISYWMVHFEADPGDCLPLPSPSRPRRLLANGGGAGQHTCPLRTC